MLGQVSVMGEVEFILTRQDIKHLLTGRKIVVLPKEWGSRMPTQILLSYRSEKELQAREGKQG